MRWRSMIMISTRLVRIARHHNTEQMVADILDRLLITLPSNLYLGLWKSTM